MFAALIAVLTACGGAAGEAPRITLRVVNWAGDLELMGEQRIAQRWAARNPGVNVVVESITTNYGEKLVTAIASGAPPDVFLLDIPDVPAFVERGLVLDLAPHVERVEYDTAGVFPQVLSVFRRGRQLFAFPKGFTPLVIYYNRGLFRELGVSPPPDTGWTWEAFLAAARALARDIDGDGRTDTYAINYPRRLYEWIPWVWSAGGDILDPRGSRTRGHLDGEPAVRTFEFLTSLVTAHRVAPPVQYLRTGDPMAAGRFYIGKQAMLVSGHWQMPRLVAYAARGALEIGVAPIPHRPGASPQTVIYTSGWAVPVNARHRRLAVNLAAFLAGEEAQRMRAESRLEIPALQAVAREFAARDTTGVEAGFLRQVPRARPSWGAVVKDFHRVEELSVDIMDRHLLRGEPLPAVAAEVARRIDEALRR